MKRWKGVVLAGVLSLLILSVSGCNNSDNNAQSDSLDDDSEVSMTYHDNYVLFQNDHIEGGTYIVNEYYVTSGQDPDHHIEVGTRAHMDVYSNSGTMLGQLDFNLGRKGSTDTADWWNDRISASESIHTNGPNELNFAMGGEFTFFVNGYSYVISDFFIGQGHAIIENNWWVGGKTCSNTEDEIMVCDAKDENGNTVKIQFNLFNSNEFLLYVK
jgi:hypothetical protein